MSDADAAKALIREADADAGLARYDDVVERFGDSADPAVRAEVARALVKKAWKLRHADRLDEAIRVCEDLAARFSGPEAVEVERQLAQAAFNRGVWLGRLGRPLEEMAAYDEIVARWASSDDPRIRPRVSWSLWNKSYVLDDLGRSDECEELYGAIADRRDDTLDPKLGKAVHFSLWRRYHAHAGDTAAQRKTLDELIDRFRDSTEPAFRETLASAITAKARLAESQAEKLRIYDDALGWIDRETQPDVLLEVLYRKGFALESSSVEAAAVVFDSALTAYAELVALEPPGPDDTAKAIVSALETAWLPSGAERDRLVRALGDVTEPRELSARATPDVADLAALLAETLAGDCWVVFAFPEDTAQARAEFGKRAADLYASAAPFVADPEVDDRATGAAVVLRSIADGFAILSREWTESRRRELVLPVRADVEYGIRLMALDEWAAELGHPLALLEDPDATEERIDELRTAALESGGFTDDDVRDLAKAFLSVAATRDLVAAACDSARGREGLGHEQVRWFAAWQLNRARHWTAWARRCASDAEQLAGFMVAVAQSVFEAASVVPASSAGLVPSTDFLRAAAQELELERWLGELPDWLAPEEE